MLRVTSLLHRYRGASNLPRCVVAVHVVLRRHLLHHLATILTFRIHPESVFGSATFRHRNVHPLGAHAINVISNFSTLALRTYIPPNFSITATIDQRICQDNVQRLIVDTDRRLSASLRSVPEVRSAYSPSIQRNMSQSSVLRLLIHQINAMQPDTTARSATTTHTYVSCLHTALRDQRASTSRIHHSGKHDQYWSFSQQHLTAISSGRGIPFH